MKFKVVLSAILVLAILFTSAVSVYAWGALAICLRSYSGGFSTATAAIGSPGLENGTWYVYAKIDEVDLDAGAYASETVMEWASDYYNGTSLPVHAAGTICGHDGGGKYVCDHDSDDI